MAPVESLCKTVKGLFEATQNFIFFLESPKVLRLFTKNGGNGFEGVTIPVALGERISGQFYACL